MGIEFSYAAETAFVSPTLLKIGTEQTDTTFFASPISKTLILFLSFLRGQCFKKMCRETFNILHKLGTIIAS
jgi:hypothetical protein